MLFKSHIGIKGVVYDAESGETVDRAVVRVAKLNQKENIYQKVGS